jgi:hypothetical protein
LKIRSATRWPAYQIKGFSVLEPMKRLCPLDGGLDRIALRLVPPVAFVEKMLGALP